MNKKKINQIKKALLLLQEAFDYNYMAHNYSSRSQEAYSYYDHEEARELSLKKEDCYIEKQKYIELAIQYIKKKSLPIKYWCNDWIIYFCFQWHQISFHSFSKKIREWKIKKYNGKWSNRPNGDDFPLYFRKFLNII